MAEIPDTALIQIGVISKTIENHADALDALSHRIAAVETRATLTPDEALWVATESAKAEAALVAAQTRKAFWSTEKKAILGVLTTVPFSVGIGYVVAQVLPRLSLHF